MLNTKQVALEVEEAPMRFALSAQMSMAVRSLSRC